MKKLASILLILIVSLTIVFAFWQTPIDYLGGFVDDNSLLSISIFIFLMIISTVFSPLTVLPMVPTFGLLLGSFNTAIYSIGGWVIGSMIAFWIARSFGKPVLEKFISKTDLEKYNKYVPEDINFWWVIFLRMIIPVDILSYLVGLFTRMSVVKYFWATFIGVIPFSFIFAYGYEIVFFKNVFATVLSGVFILAILLLVWYFHRKGKI
ncbi:VTT domain-containing protein [Patescibacteria group bacterium]|nr:VTT domain-containing protein [Patescibacteria group bacterium]MCG2694884.1 VTT domain-containing protein [Candidatus Parcubacteria bacterium]